MAEAAAGLALGAIGALPVVVLLYQFVEKLCDTISSIQGFGDDLNDLISDFGMEKQKFTKWAKGYGLSEITEHNSGWYKGEYENLLGPLTRMFSYFAKAQMLIDPYVDTGTNAYPPNLPGKHCTIPGLEKLPPEIQRTWNELQTQATNINNSQSTSKIFRRGLKAAEELEKLIKQIRRLNDDLKTLWPSNGGTGEVIATEFRVPIKHPFQKNNTFFGRAQILKEMKEIFGTASGYSPPSFMKRRIVTLYGIGGAGKSQICAQYAHTHTDTYTAIFWITATTADDVRRTVFDAVHQIIRHYTVGLPLDAEGLSGYQRAARALGLDLQTGGQRELDAAIEKRSAIEVLKHWLSKKSNNRWLLIIDDYCIPTGSDYNLNNILPTEDVGHILVNTQKRFHGDQNRIRIPESIGEEDGIRLLKALGCDGGESDDSCDKYAREIVGILDGFPLALRLAGAYAYQTSFKQCVKELRDGCSSRFIFEDSDDLKKDSLGNIWTLSFSKLGKNAQKMLYLLSFMGNDIPSSLVERAEDGIKTYCMTDERKAIYDALGNLKSFSFITRKPGNGDNSDGGYEIHDLVNQWAQFQLNDAELQDIAEHAASIVTSSLILDSNARASDEWEYERKIMSQIDRCYNIFQNRLARDNDHSTMDHRTRSIACKLAKVYEYHSITSKPEALYRRSLRDVKGGSETLDELKMMNYLGLNLSLRTKLLRDGLDRVNPLDWHERAYRGMQRLGLADSDADVMETKKHMADFFTRNSEPLKAISKYNDILRGQEAKFGKDDPQTLEIRCKLGDALTAHGQVDEALRQLEKVQSAREEGHPEALGVLFLIAKIHDRKGDYEKALKDYKRVLRGQEKSLGRNHYSTVKTIHMIGDIHRRKQRYPEALHHFKMALAGLETIFGPNNSQGLTLIVRGGIADISDLEGHYPEALEEYKVLHKQYKEIYKANGNVSVWELRAAVDIGRVLGRMGHYKMALDFLMKTEQTLKKKEADGELQNHFLTPASVLRIGNAHENQGQYDKAMESYTWVKNRCFAVRGEGHTTTLAAVCSIASVLNKQGKYAEALAQYRIAEAGQQVAVGDTHHATLEAILGKAEVLQNMGKPNQSTPLYQAVMDKLRKMETNQDQGVVAVIPHEKREHPMVLMAKYGMGRALESEKRYAEALQYYYEAQEGWKCSLEGGHTLALMVELGIGRISEKKKDYREALRIYDRILQDMASTGHPFGNEQPLRMEHPLRYETVCNKGSVLFKLGQYQDAKASYEEALEGLQRILGDEHPATLGAMQGKADVLVKEKSYRDALELYRKVLVGLRNKLGDQHPKTIRIRKKVSSVQRRKKWGRWLCFSP